jgi:Ca2+:H+ antiporter
MLSGLLNATFGNAVEMIMVVTFLQKHDYVVVKMTCIGSVLSNMLLVLGMSFFFGGLVKSKSKRNQQGSTGEPLLTIMEKEQKYSTVGALANTSMLLLSCLVLGLITVFHFICKETHTPVSMLPISRASSILIIASYVAFIMFQLITHKETMADLQGEDEEEEEEEEEEASLTLTCSLLLLFFSTVVVAIASEFLTGAMSEAMEESNMTKGFVGIVLLPIVGNACEHAAAVRFAMNDKAGLSVGIAIGSGVQIALFVAPLSVLLGWFIGPDSNGNSMDLDFGMLDVSVLTLSVVVILSVVLDGKSTWLEGYMLMTAYMIIGALYWYLPNSAASE